ncbi:hypothetical protein UFOVP653_41 [uncultured Caudovirales phage]|uniref:Uncharacterized protein n=1 Tax=uncultured Caudovirales phage TaxID=2100421 RepID=A0A6J5ND14_9CAUD|nr:hypothetical protein UFOVP653_41 [uncultured Caudovirales phage]
MTVKYWISAAGQNYWMATNATTLRGAKTLAGRKFQPAFGGRIEVAELVNYGGESRYEVVARRYGWDRWVNS